MHVIRRCCVCHMMCVTACAAACDLMLVWGLALVCAFTPVWLSANSLGDLGMLVFPFMQVCPYYGSRMAVPEADIILAPYRWGEEQGHKREANALGL